MAGKRYYNRYNDFIINGQQTVVPYVNLQDYTDQLEPHFFYYGRENRK